MVKTVAVLGAGTMGHGIAQAAIAAGYTTTLCDVSEAQLAKAREVIDGIVKKGVEIGKISVPDAEAMLGRLTTTPDLATALAKADLVIEAVPEKIDLKLQLLGDIEQLAPAGAVIASNTSALSITEIAAVLQNPGRVGGMHFFNPVHKMKLVEIVRALETTP
jgi:3-hydroxybutyryl-CoA dehydrogenase